ncbi:hypothetical protein Glove_482g45 [Diversispora epigaea]|uniref:BTB domain-containing protein n=1 Tax=Diversispora epigaea TaxID=1348612 RepID=A0A397GJM8_9GLOM|nr:hypothetical protein Glove_482g45 [Diversispora epigaea]
MSFKFFDKLSQELLNDKKEYNVIIEIDKEGNKKSFKAHSVVLHYRSLYFGRELENATANKNHIKTIIKPSISAQIFEIILEYIYGEIVNIENTDTKTVYELMINVNELEFKELSLKLESYLIESKASWLRTHFSLVYRSIFDSNEFKGLKNFYNDIIVKYPNLIFESEDFSSLQETVLVSILKKDDLQVEETKIWDYVIKWGIAQNPTLPTNSEEWSNENFMTLKTTLQQCLPLIRYFHISVNESFSTIINKEHVAELSSWIDRKSTTYSLANIPYEFQLILRGSRDGFHPETFWNMCHGCFGTIVVAKVAETDEIVGGYNPLAWDNLTGGSNMETNDSFIFSLKNGDIKNSILS